MERLGAPLQSTSVDPESLAFRRGSLNNLGWRWASEKRGIPQAVLHVFRSDCQQISAHPSERNAAWMSARLS